MEKFTKSESDLIVSLIIDNMSGLKRFGKNDNIEQHESLAAKVRNMTDW